MPNPYFPFHDLGFRANPFRALDDAEWADIVVLPPAALQAAETGRHLQVIGERGHGKTSTLLGLGAHLRRAGQTTRYEYLPEQQEAFQSALNGIDVFLLDEAQRLNGPERARLLRAAPAHRLILGSHEDLTQLFAAANQPLATLRPEAGGRPHLEAVLARRLAYFALSPGSPAITLDDSAVTFLLQTYGPDLRSIQWFLYEIFQGLRERGPISSEQLRKNY
ncbi:MAG: hypothetical protein ABI847_02040 [Anaerolineales bacterium]